MNDIITDIKTLQEETLLNLKNSKANNTVRAYKSDFNDFGLFCTQNGFKSLPSDPKVVSLYLTYLSTKNFWISSYLTHGGSDIFYPILMWKILGVESIGAARSVFFFSILFVKLLTVLLSYQLTKISNLNTGSKILFFTIFTSILISMSHYNLQSDGRYFSSRDLYIILFLIFFIELFIHSKFRPFFIILISLIATISILLHIDIGIYINFVLKR